MASSARLVKAYVAEELFCVWGTAEMRALPVQEFRGDLSLVFCDGTSVPSLQKYGGVYE